MRPFTPAPVITAPSPPVRTLRHRNLLWAYRARVFAVHIGDPSSNQATTLESQMIHMIQELFGQTLRRPPSIKRGGGLLDVAVGALGGITGPLAAFPGAFVTIWCGMRGWDKVVQRSIYQPYILILQVLTFCALSVVSGRSMLDEGLAAYALPGIAGAYLGLQLFQKLSDGQFHKLVNLALIVS